MRINIVSDVHFRVAGLAEAGKDADLFVSLGDLILFLDYDDPSEGIFAELFGAANAMRYIEMRNGLRFDDARQFSRELWEAIGADPWTVISEQVGAQYMALFEAMPGGYLTYGNVDVPVLWPRYLRPDHTVVDGGTIEHDGLRIGFVGGGLRTPMNTPNEISDEEYAAKVDALGEVDVLCAHIPPAIPEATFDVVARRLERGSEHLLQYIHDVQPRYVVHGHVHNPLVPRVTVGKTEILNVGHFRSTGVPYVLHVD